MKEYQEDKYQKICLNIVRVMTFVYLILSVNIFNKATYGPRCTDEFIYPFGYMMFCYVQLVHLIISIILSCKRMYVNEELMIERSRASPIK